MMKFNALFVFALALLSMEPTPVAGKRLIVQLSAPPLAKHHMYATLRRRHAADRAANGDEISSVLGPLRELVSQQQRSFLTSVADKWPVVMFQTDRGARPATVHRLLNAVTIRVPDAEVEHAKEVISQMPGVVAVSEEQKFTLNLHTSRSAIGAPEAWGALNSTERTAGKGIKIAVVDAGIYTKGDMFSDAGMEFPTDGTYPQGDVSNTNKKVIVSRMYIDPDDQPASYDDNSYPAATSSMHGIHCASTAAGSPVTTGSTSLNLTGVAPGAWLMNYRIFYNNRKDDSVSASDSQILKALDDLTADGADVASNSWGSEAFYENTPTDLAMKAMTEAGVVTVVSAGNTGPNTLTVQKYNPTIRVGATTSGSGLSYYVMTSSPSVGYNIGYLDSQAIKTEVYGSYTLYGPEEDDELACSPLKRKFDKGDNVAVVALRGSCSFIDKITNIANAGASLAIIGNHREGGYKLMNMATTGVTINAVSIGHEPAMDLINLTKKSTTPTVTLSKSYTEKIVSVEKDM